MPDYDDRFPAPHISVDVVILTVENGILKVVVEECRDLGFVLPHEIAFEQLAFEKLAGRLVERRIRLSGIELDQVGVFSSPNRDCRGRVISVAFIGVVEAGCLIAALEKRTDLQLASAIVDHADGKAMLYDRRYQIEPVFDQDAIIGKAIQLLRDRLDTSMLAFGLLPRTFTLRDLRQVHEAILGHKLNPVSFRKRMLGRVLRDGRELIETGLVRRGSHRPAAVYRLG